MISKQLLKLYWAGYFFRRKLPSGLTLFMLTVVVLLGFGIVDWVVNFTTGLNSGPSLADVFTDKEYTATETVAEQFFKLPALDNVSGDNLVKLGIRAAAHEKNQEHPP